MKSVLKFTTLAACLLLASAQTNSTAVTLKKVAPAHSVAMDANLTMSYTSKIMTNGTVDTMAVDVVL